MIRINHTITCDLCGSWLTRTDKTIEQLIADAERIGWDIRDEDEGGSDRCHACRSKP